MLQLGEKWRATFMESWPDNLWELTLPAIEIILSPDDRKIIGSATPSFQEEFELTGRLPDALSCQKELETAIADTEDSGAFLRLGSASFKRPGPPRLPIVGLDQALDEIRGLNERAARFIADSLIHDYPLSLFVFPWQNIAPWAEFRMFVFEGQLVGVSQYHCEERFEPLHAAFDELHVKIADFWQVVGPSLPLESVILDVFVETNGDDLGEVRLIELNPFIRRADACLFSWAKHGDFDGGFRVTF